MYRRRVRRFTILKVSKGRNKREEGERDHIYINCYSHNGIYWYHVIVLLLYLQLCYVNKLDVEQKIKRMKLFQ